METPIFIKAIILILLAGIFYALGSGLYYLLHDGGQSKRLVKSLFWRLVLSLILFALLLFAFAMGWISPHPMI